MITRSGILHIKLQDSSDYHKIRMISNIARGNRSKSPGMPPNDPAELLKSIKKISSCFPPGGFLSAGFCISFSDVLRIINI